MLLRGRKDDLSILEVEDLAAVQRRATRTKLRFYITQTADRHSSRHGASAQESMLHESYNAPVVEANVCQDDEPLGGGKVAVHCVVRGRE